MIWLSWEALKKVSSLFVGKPNRKTMEEPSKSSLAPSVHAYHPETLAKGTCQPPYLLLNITWVKRSGRCPTLKAPPKHPSSTPNSRPPKKKPPPHTVVCLSDRFLPKTSARSSPAFNTKLTKGSKRMLGIWRGAHRCGRRDDGSLAGSAPSPRSVWIGPSVLGATHTDPN